MVKHTPNHHHHVHARPFNHIPYAKFKVPVHRHHQTFRQPHYLVHHHKPVHNQPFAPKHPKTIVFPQVPLSHNFIPIQAAVQHQVAHIEAQTQAPVHQQVAHIPAEQPKATYNLNVDYSAPQNVEHSAHQNIDYTAPQSVDHTQTGYSYETPTAPQPQAQALVQYQPSEEYHVPQQHQFLPVVQNYEDSVNQHYEHEYEPFTTEKPHQEIIISRPKPVTQAPIEFTTSAYQFLDDHQQKEEKATISEQHNQVVHNQNQNDQQHNYQVVNQLPHALYNHEPQIQTLQVQQYHNYHQIEEGQGQNEQPQTQSYQNYHQIDVGQAQNDPQPQQYQIYHQVEGSQSHIQAQQAQQYQNYHQIEEGHGQAQNEQPQTQSYQNYHQIDDGQAQNDPQPQQYQNYPQIEEGHSQVQNEPQTEQHQNYHQVDNSQSQNEPQIEHNQNNHQVDESQAQNEQNYPHVEEGPSEVQIENLPPNRYQHRQKLTHPKPKKVQLLKATAEPATSYANVYQEVKVSEKVTYKGQNAHAGYHHHQANNNGHQFQTPVYISSTEASVHQYQISSEAPKNEVITSNLNANHHFKSEEVTEGPINDEYYDNNANDHNNAQNEQSAFNYEVNFGPESSAIINLHSNVEALKEEQAISTEEIKENYPVFEESSTKRPQLLQHAIQQNRQRYQKQQRQKGKFVKSSTRGSLKFKDTVNELMDLADERAGHDDVDDDALKTIIKIKQARKTTVQIDQTDKNEDNLESSILPKIHGLTSTYGKLSDSVNLANHKLDGQDIYSNAKYNYANDNSDVKNSDHWEERDGNVVKGGYTLYEADGTKRIVEYTADKQNGFKAIVTKADVPTTEATKSTTATENSEHENKNN